MLDKNQAKSKFRFLLTLMLVGFFWPIIGLILGLIADIIGINNTSLIVLSLTLAWLALFVWLFVELWKTASKIEVTPWASLWIFFPFIGIFLIGMLILEPLKYIGDGKPANKQLPLSWSIIKDTWNVYAANFKTSIKISSWFVYLFAILGLLSALVAYFKIDWLPWFTIAFMIPVTAGTLWINLLLMQQRMAAEKGGNTTFDLKKSFKEFLSYLWIVILIIMFAGGPMMLALALFIGPQIASQWQNIDGLLIGNEGALSSMASSFGMAGISMIGLILVAPAWIWLIYKSNMWNNLSLAVFTNKNIKGYAALKECERIAKGRWWGLLWKNQLGGMFFGAYSLLISLGMNIAAVILALILRSLNLGTATSEFLGNALNGVVQMVVMPLFIIFMLKIYQAFDKTSD